LDTDKVDKCFYQKFRVTEVGNPALFKQLLSAT